MAQPLAAFTPRRAGLVVAALAAAAGALTLNHDLVGVFYDDGLYAGIAVALAHGLGYVHPICRAPRPWCTIRPSTRCS